MKSVRNRTVLLQSAEGLTFKELLCLVSSKVRRKVAGLGRSDARYQWTFGGVIDATGPELLLRNYLEHRDLREYLNFVRERRPINKAADIGCGFGRLEMLLSEYAREVVGFEREPGLAESARLLLSDLQPRIHIKQISDFAELAWAAAEFDFVMTFTVLMHLTDRKAQAVIERIKHMTAPGGFALLCEQTDPADKFGDLTDERTLLAHGRDIPVYEEWMRPLTLVRSSVRVIEPTYRMRNVGSYMLFQQPSQ
jgi:SAM-dependent methyltransferase